MKFEDLKIGDTVVLNEKFCNANWIGAIAVYDGPSRQGASQYEFRLETPVKGWVHNLFTTTIPFIEKGMELHFVVGTPLYEAMKE